MIKDNMELMKEEQFHTPDHKLQSDLMKLNMEQEERIKKLEEALLQTNKMASLGQLVAGVAHEISNPLTYIRANTELLKKYWKAIVEQTNTDDSIHLSMYIKKCDETLEAIYKGTDIISDIINSLKNYARQEKLHYEVFDVNYSINEACKLVKSEFDKNKVDLKNRTDKDRYFVYGSSRQMEQIFVNLLMNSLTAIKASNTAGDGCVEIEIKKDENSMLRIFVKDNGCGIAEENISRIFNPFYTTNQASGGTGLGLYIVYKIVKEHGGDIEVRSREDKGTEFVINLPDVNRSKIY